MRKFTGFLAAFCLFLGAIISLGGCAGQKGAVNMASLTTVSGEAVSDEAVSDEPCLTIHFTMAGQVEILDPTQKSEQVSLTLKKGEVDDYELVQGDFTHYVEDVYSDEDIDRGGTDSFFADLSFAGLKKAMVSSYAVGCMVAPDDSIVLLKDQEGTGEKLVKGNCLALFVTELKEKKKVEDNYLQPDDTENYILILDYAHHTFYKKKTDSEIFETSFSDWHTMEFADFNGDGKEELLIYDLYNKSIHYRAYQLDLDTGKLKLILSSEEIAIDQAYKEDYEKTYEEDWSTESGFLGTLKDDYQVTLAYKNIGWKKTVSLPEDCIYYPRESLEIENGSTYERDNDWISYDLRAWDKGKLKKKFEIFLYGIDSVETCRQEDGHVRVRIEQSVMLVHRSECIGEMYTYFEYDEKKKRMTMADAEFVSERESMSNVTDIFKGLSEISDQTLPEEDKEALIEYRDVIEGKSKFLWLCGFDEKEEKKDNHVVATTKTVTEKCEVTMDEFYSRLCEERGEKREENGLIVDDIVLYDILKTGNKDLVLDIFVSEDIGFEELFLHREGGQCYGFLKEGSTEWLKKEPCYIVADYEIPQVTNERYMKLSFSPEQIELKEVCREENSKKCYINGEKVGRKKYDKYLEKLMFSEEFFEPDEEGGGYACYVEPYNIP